jgi:plasmid maintenance system antidote protein VapI
MTPIELKQWQADLGLSEAAMAHYLGVPVHTLRGWIKGTRALQAAPLRLVRVLQLIQDEAKGIHDELIQEARASEPAKRQAGRPAGSKNRASSSQVNAGDALVTQEVSEVPSWLSGAL